MPFVNKLDVCQSALEFLGF